MGSFGAAALTGRHRRVLFGTAAGMLAMAVVARAGVDQSKPTPKAEAPVTFTEDIAPVLKAKCTPCHFKGGKVFDKLPFDDYETVKARGLRLNTRLKDADAKLVDRWVNAKSPK